MTSGPQVKTVSYFSPESRLERASVVKPLMPAVPASVVTMTLPAPSAESSSTPQSLSAVCAPTTASNWTPAAASERAQPTMGVTPMPPATRTALPLQLPVFQGCPQGETTVDVEPGAMAARRRVPSPTTAYSISIVSAASSTRENERGMRRICAGSPGTARFTNCPGSSPDAMPCA